MSARTRTRARRPAADEATLGLLAGIRRKTLFLTRILHSDVNLDEAERITLAEITVDIVDAADDVSHRLSKKGGR